MRKWFKNCMYDYNYKIIISNYTSGCLNPMIFFIICDTFALKNVYDDNLIVSKRRLYIERENKVEIGPVIL